MNFYIISPNVTNKSEEYDLWLESILSKKYAYMGWEPGDNSFGSMFANISIGDFILIAQGRNSNKRIFLAGFAASKATMVDFDELPTTVQGIKLERTMSSEVLDLLNLDFGGCAYGNANQIPAIYRLYPDNNENDKNLIKNIMESHSQMELRSRIKTLLKSNKNLILTGAPGTGKTFLAREIAEEITGNKENIQFVQFHPSYDYTDFVEGLRPTNPDQNGNIGFERVDGVLKSFCKKAVKNLIDSQKSEELLHKEKHIEDFLIKLTDDETQLTTKKGSEFTVTGTDDKWILIDIPTNAKTNQLKVSLDDFQNIVNNDKKLSKVCDIRNHFERRHNQQQDSYLFTLYENFRRESDLADYKVKEKPTKQDFVIIIDEINRGELSKIFGELFFSIDPGYRVEEKYITHENKNNIIKVKTQYQNLIHDSDLFAEGFYIPENLYIIGTMNDIDRSVESFDFAMRRRFAWHEVSAIDRISMWEPTGDHKGISNKEVRDEAKNRMEKLNEAIQALPSLSEAYHIGPAYFLKLNLYLTEENQDIKEAFQQLWNNHLKGLLFEYLRCMPNSETELKKLKKAYDLEEIHEDSN